MVFEAFAFVIRVCVHAWCMLKDVGKTTLKCDILCLL